MVETNGQEIYEYIPNVSYVEGNSDFWTVWFKILS